MAGWCLKWLYLSYDSTQKGVFRFYCSIDAMDSIKLPSVSFWTQDGDIQDGGIQTDVLLLSCTHATHCRAATFDHYV